MEVIASSQCGKKEKSVHKLVISLACSNHNKAQLSLLAALGLTAELNPVFSLVDLQFHLYIFMLIIADSVTNFLLAIDVHCYLK